MTGRLRLPTVDIQYLDTGGDGPPVVLTHGAGLDHTVFDAQTEALNRAGYRTVVWDIRGHGRSTLGPRARLTAKDALDDLGALIDQLQLDQPVLVGHSLGGNLSQAFVRANPERVGGLIVLNSTWNTGPLSRTERLSLGLAAPLLTLIPASRLPGVSARAATASSEARAKAELVFAQMPKRAFLDAWRATASLIGPDPGYRTPTLLGLIRGTEDRTGNIATAMPKWAQAENIQEQVIPAAGHIVTLDAPEATSKAILDLLEQ